MKTLLRLITLSLLLIIALAVIPLISDSILGSTLDNGMWVFNNTGGDIINAPFFADFQVARGEMPATTLGIRAYQGASALTISGSQIVNHWGDGTPKRVLVSGTIPTLSAPSVYLTFRSSAASVDTGQAHLTKAEVCAASWNGDLRAEFNGGTADAFSITRDVKTIFCAMTEDEATTYSGVTEVEPRKLHRYFSSPTLVIWKVMDRTPTRAHDFGARWDHPTSQKWVTDAARNGLHPEWYIYAYKNVLAGSVLSVHIKTQVYNPWGQLRATYMYRPRIRTGPSYENTIEEQNVDIAHNHAEAYQFEGCAVTAASCVPQILYATNVAYQIHSRQMPSYPLTPRAPGVTPNALIPGTAINNWLTSMATRLGTFNGQAEIAQWSRAVRKRCRSNQQSMCHAGFATYQGLGAPSPDLSLIPHFYAIWPYLASNPNIDVSALYNFMNGVILPNAHAGATQPIFYLEQRQAKEYCNGAADTHCDDQARRVGYNEFGRPFALAAHPGESFITGQNPDPRATRLGGTRFNLSSFVVASNVGTGTTSVAHGFGVNQKIVLSDLVHSPDNLTMTETYAQLMNGQLMTVLSVPTPTTFTGATSGVPNSTWAGGYTGQGVGRPDSEMRRYTVVDSAHRIDPIYAPARFTADPYWTDLADMQAGYEQFVTGAHSTNSAGRGGKLGCISYGVGTAVRKPAWMIRNILTAVILLPDGPQREAYKKIIKNNAACEEGRAALTVEQGAKHYSLAVGAPYEFGYSKWRIFDSSSIPFPNPANPFPIFEARLVGDTNVNEQDDTYDLTQINSAASPWMTNYYIDVAAWVRAQGFDYFDGLHKSVLANLSMEMYKITPATGIGYQWATHKTNSPRIEMYSVTAMGSNRMRIVGRSAHGYTGTTKPIVWCCADRWNWPAGWKNFETSKRLPMGVGQITATIIDSVTLDVTHSSFAGPAIGSAYYAPDHPSYGSTCCPVSGKLRLFFNKVITAPGFQTDGGALATPEEIRAALHPRYERWGSLPTDTEFGGTGASVRAAEHDNGYFDGAISILASVIDSGPGARYYADALTLYPRFARLNKRQDRFFSSDSGCGTDVRHCGAIANVREPFPLPDKVSITPGTTYIDFAFGLPWTGGPARVGLIPASSFPNSSSAGDILALCDGGGYCTVRVSVDVNGDFLVTNTAYKARITAGPLGQAREYFDVRTK